MSGITTPEKTVSYTYDAEGLRIKEDDGTGAKWYLIDKQLPYGQVTNDPASMLGIAALFYSLLKKHFFGAPFRRNQPSAL